MSPTLVGHTGSPQHLAKLAGLCVQPFPCTRPTPVGVSISNLVPLPSFELGYRAYEARTIANTVPAALLVEEFHSLILYVSPQARMSGTHIVKRWAVIGATSLDRTEFFRSSGEREHQLHQGCF